MKIYLATVLLCVTMVLVAFGVHINNFILLGIGGFLAGIYNAMIYSKNPKEK